MHLAQSLPEFFEMNGHTLQLLGIQIANDCSSFFHGLIVFNNTWITIPSLKRILGMFLRGVPLPCAQPN